MRGINLKRIVGMLIAAAALSAGVTFFGLSATAEAQDAPIVPPPAADDAQRASQNPDTTMMARPAAANQLPTHRVVPGDCLWSIAQERLGPNATPAQVMNEVEQTYALNRNQIGDDPNLILVGQELLLPPVAEAPTLQQTPVVAEQVPEPAVQEQPSPQAEQVTEPVGTEEPTVVEPSVLPNQSGTEAEPEAATPQPSSEPNTAPGANDNGEHQWLIGLAALLLSLGAAILLAWAIVKTLRQNKPLRREGEWITMPHPAQSGPQDRGGTLLKAAGNTHEPAVPLVAVSERSDPVLEEALKEKVRIYRTQEIPSGTNGVSPVVLCPSEGAVAPEVGRLRALVPQAPLLVFGPYADANLAREALQMGANGFIHAQMMPEQISRILSTASKNEVVMPRGILEAFLEDMVESREDLINLTPRQRRILEQVVEEPVNRSEIAVPKEFSEDFLMN